MSEQLQMNEKREGYPKGQLIGLFLGAAVAYRRGSKAAPSTVRTALMLFLVINGIGESLFDIGRVSLLITAAVFAATANDAATVRWTAADADRERRVGRDEHLVQAK